MAYQVQATLDIGSGHDCSTHYSVTDVIEILSGSNPPGSIPFPNLDYPAGASYYLAAGRGVPILGTRISEVARSAGLADACSIFYANYANGAGYVFNASAGRNQDYGFNAAKTAAFSTDSEPFDDIYAVCAHLGKSSKIALAAVKYLEENGIPPNNILVVTNLPLGQFGLDNRFRLGY